MISLFTAGGFSETASFRRSIKWRIMVPVSVSRFSFRIPKNFPGDVERIQTY